MSQLPCQDSSLQAALQPLAESDAITMPTSADTLLLQRHLDTALIEWDKCFEKLSSVAKQLADEEPKFPYFSLLSKGRLTDGSAADALMLDFLRHVCFIQVILLIFGAVSDEDAMML